MAGVARKAALELRKLFLLKYEWDLLFHLGPLCGSGQGTGIMGGGCGRGFRGKSRANAKRGLWQKTLINLPLVAFDRGMQSGCGKMLTLESEASTSRHR